jgi:DNA anti-recombination protein RmuC
MNTIIKEHRLNDHCHLVDDTDLNNINNTFKLIGKTCESMNNHMNSLEKSMNTRIDSLEKSTNTRIDSLEKTMNSKHTTLVVLISGLGILISAIGIGLAGLKIFL